MKVQVNDDTRVAWTSLGTVKASLPELLDHEDVKIRESAQIVYVLVTLLENQKPAINLLRKFTNIIEDCGGWPDTSSSQSALYNLAIEAEQALQGVQPPEADLQAELDEWRKLRDPKVLHANLCRGFPAKLTAEQLLHIAGDESQRKGGE